MVDDAGPVACGLCGARPDDSGTTVTWVRDHDRWLCPTCAREHVRDIEARLDPEWWA